MPGRRRGKVRKEQDKVKVFNQKKVNHIFHYNDNFEVVLKILKNGFAPSYCKETVDEDEYYIPMVSFCNIPLRDVDLYMRYGKYGIGMSLDWALKNSISPVVYIHENTPFKSLRLEVNRTHSDLIFNQLIRNTDKILNNDFPYKENKESMNAITSITIRTIQFFKNWKTMYKGKEIITYQEREWRFIPQLDGEKRLITKLDKEFKELNTKGVKDKPHLPHYPLAISNINDLRYIVINNENQRKKVISTLNTKFGKDKVVEAVLSGKLVIIQDDLIQNDF